MAPLGRYENWHQWQSVIYGEGALGALRAELDRVGARRVFVVTTPSLVREGAVLGSVVDALGDRCVGSFGACRQYVPRAAVVAAAKEARVADPDLFLSVGGGSVVDTAKGAALMLCEGLEAAGELDSYRLAAEGGPRSLTADPLPLFAFPTTLSGAEYTGMIGITEEQGGHREPYREDRLAPATVFLDPAMTLATPDPLWCATGIKSLSDAFEQYSTGMAGPVMEALTLRAFEWLHRDLPASVEGDIDARLNCQIASWLTLYGVFNAGTKVGIGAAVRHQLGMLHGIRHGEATCGVLTEVVRRTAPSEPERLHPLVRAVGCDPQEGDEMKQRDALALRLGVLLRRLNLPSGLAELGLEKSDLDLLAARAVGDFAARTRTARVFSTEELRDLLEDAFE
jgi:alcohol dehydrogenase class IV